MASDKNPAEAANELIKALGEKLDELKKMDLPQTPEKADGGQESSGSIPSMPKQAGGTTDAEMAKDEMVVEHNTKAKCPQCGKKTAQAHRSESGKLLVTACKNCTSKKIKKDEMPSNLECNLADAEKDGVAKMDLPSTPDKASGGQITKEEMPTGIRPEVKESMDRAPVKKSEDLDALDVAQALSKAVVEKIANVRQQLEKMEQLEAAGNASLKKGIGSIPSATPSGRQIADGDPNRMLPTPRSVFSLIQKGEGKYTPWDKGTAKPKAGKDNSADEGSGGQVKADVYRSELKKEAMAQVAPPKAPALKPAGIPAMKQGEAPKAPKPPQAAGAAPTAIKSEFQGMGAQAAPAAVPVAPVKKMDLPQTPEKADGGQESKGSIPAMPKQAGGTTDAEMNKMDLPQTPEKANGGKISPEQSLSMSKAAMPMHPSPVFHALKPRMGGKDMASQHMTADASKAPAPAMNAAPKAAAMPTVEQHADRQSTFAQHMPPGKFGKAELDSAKCPKCKKGMTLCKCNYGSKT